MKKLTKRIVAMGAAIMMMGTMVISAGTVEIDKTFTVENSYLSSIQTYGYNSDKNNTFASNLTKCKRNNYTAILSCAEIVNQGGGTYANATNFLPSADSGSFIKVTANKADYYAGKYARFWSFVRDEKGNNKGEINITRKIVF